MEDVIPARNTTLNTPFRGSSAAIAATNISILHDTRSIKLIHHYIRVVCLTFSDVYEVQDVWQRLVPRKAIQDEALTHSVLAISALHLFHLVPKTENLKHTAMYHLDHALHSFRYAS